MSCPLAEVPTDSFYRRCKGFNDVVVVVNHYCRIIHLKMKMCSKLWIVARDFEIWWIEHLKNSLFL